MKQVKHYEFETYLEEIGQTQIKRRNKQELYIKAGKTVAAFIRPNQFLIPVNWSPKPRDTGQLLLF